MTPAPAPGMRPCGTGSPGVFPARVGRKIGGNMGFIGSLILIAIGIGMVILGHPKAFMSRFIQVYIVGQLYVMTAMVLMVLGVTFFIADWPF